MPSKGKSVVVTYADITDKKSNPRLCLSALRYTGNCYKCPNFETGGGYAGKPCDSRIISKEAKEYFKLKEKKERLTAELKEVEERIKNF